TPAWPAVPRSWTAAAVLLLAVVGFAGVAVAQQSRINALHDDVDAAHTRIAEQKDQMRTLEAQVSSAEATLVKQRALTYWAALPGVTTAVISPAATMTPEASGVGGNPRAMYMVSSDNSTSLLVVIDLPRLPEGLAYQAWFVAPGEAPVSAFTFLVGDSGYGQFNFVPPENVDAFTAMAVTVEPIGGSMEPTGPLVLAGDFTQR
ncbi:MAG: hypothetical protein FJ318_03335, partial [SAR202 cluster bacterium]|nr:hypothetical protein [SAR202 cluster bacterium]